MADVNTAAVVQVMLDTAAAHTLPVLTEHCTCGEPMAGPDYRASVRRHAAEQVLLALGALHEVPASTTEALVEQVRLLTLSFDGLIGFYEDALADRTAARLRADGYAVVADLATKLVRERNRLYGKASAEIGAQRAALTRAYEQRRIAVGRAVRAEDELTAARASIRFALGLDGQDLGASTLPELTARLVAEHRAVAGGDGRG